ncbi:hypothetical protein [Archangium lipolyticum]|uniref:hypothetical protein n=1 Tax=Archangium lipolyticum TaxID=2970465 RepID=UPI00214A333D|nr:hypothetical protein [Archangium lipolyticum]
MPTQTFARKRMASSLGLLLVSCSINQPIVAAQDPTGPQDLARYALIIQDTQDGRVTHDWKPLEEIDPTKLQQPLSAMRANRGIVHASSTGLDKYCEGRQDQCEQDCLSSRSPVWVGHWKYENIKIQPWREARKWWCPEHCGKQADMCKRRMGSWAEEYAAEFDEIEPAVDWIKNHREEILVGSVILIAGVTFVAASAVSGGGVLLLVPLVIVAELPPGLPTAPAITEATW